MQLNVTLYSAHVKFDVLKGRGRYFGLIVIHLFKAHTRSATTDIDTHIHKKDCGLNHRCKARSKKIRITKIIIININKC